ncbi:uncharacterized protein LOC130817954 isoform X2 [Amaranthus tricolor]|uniref:uncharacterized protein LOC130817954 isoform X2 n=1 Tax=Amaranthus tricolor TaxID=29722 RepID=UPI00258731A5|nr:uncharacterized protein LOC130817954 isoform X2 [Amaranthus tricolor]
MSEIETLGILEEISSLVSVRLQVVSYKWLSRNFLVSSNVAKKLLQEFVEKQKDDLEVVYSLAGWLKKAPPTYHIRLVPGPKLAEAKHDFDGNCSVQVYSVQACIPKDPAAIWNAEFIQADELFKQPITAENCLRDNRFCGVSNSFVKRNAEGAPVAFPVPKTKSAGLSGQAVGSSANQIDTNVQPQQKKLEQASPKLALQSSKVTTSRTETNRSGTSLQNKESDKEKTSLPNKSKGQSDKTSSGTGSSLANLWGRASSKSKPVNSVEEKVSADAQISARENSEAACSDDELDVNFKRVSNDGGKKRRVVFDDSDDDDDGDGGKNRTLDMRNSKLKFEEREECKPIIREEKAVGDLNQSGRDISAHDMEKSVKIPTLEGIQRTPEVDADRKNKPAETAPGSPKRRKVLKTRIDERGREVTEVIWEGEEADLKDTNAGKSSSDSVKNSNGHAGKAEENGPANPVNRPAAAKKSPAVGSAAPSNATGKGGSKKGANSKDPKQGNILSFFKRV